MIQPTHLMEEIHTTPSDQLLTYLLPPKAASCITTGYQRIYEGLILSSPEELATLDGISKSSVRKILALRELSRRMDVERSQKIKCIHSPKDIYNYLLDMRDLQQEQFRVILLNTKNGIICQQMISQGTINASIVTPREVFHAATKCLAACVIIAHNHPSGDCSPSKEDSHVTEALVHAGNILGISVLDHLIIGRNEYYSFQEKGVLPK